MKTLQSREELEELLQYVTSDVNTERMLHVRGAILAELEFYPSNYFFVDVWPQPNALVIICKVGVNLIFIYTNGKCDMRSLLEEVEQNTAALYSANDASLYVYLTDDLLHTMKQMMSEKEITMENSIIDQGHVYYIPRSVSIETPTLPYGYISSTLAEEDVGQIFSDWKLSNPKHYDWLRLQVRKYSNVAVRNRSGALVGYEVQYPLGGMGRLFVVPEHRKKGIARFIVRQLAIKLRQKNQDVYCIILEEDSVSLALHTKLGFEKLRGGPYHFLKFGFSFEEDA